MSAIANSTMQGLAAPMRRSRRSAAPMQSVALPTIHRTSPQVAAKGSCACGGGCPRCQKKEEFPMSRRGDASEREADRVADQVLREPVGTIGRHADMQIARAPLSNAVPSAPAALGGALSGSSRQLDASTRSFFEPRFGHDFSNVRIHTDNRAADSAHSLNAKAYTYGRDIVFGAGEYDPSSAHGQRLLAHELTHVVQQQQTSASVMRDENEAGNGVIVVDNLGCPKKACAGKDDGIRADLQRALSYTAQAIAALDGKPSAHTERLLNWYFADHSAETAKTVRTRLLCTQTALQETFDNNHYGCGDRSWAHAHTGGGDTLCEDSGAPVCLNPSYFTDLSQRERAETMIHECGHRMGLSASAAGLPDIYSREWRFLSLNTAKSLLNTDNYALFVGAVALGARTTIMPQFGALVGGTSNGGIFGKGQIAFEFQHPSLRGINVRTGIEGGHIDSAFIGSVFLGAHIADARPGKKGGVYLNLQGQLSYMMGDESGASAGAEATLGYRLGEFEIGATGGLLHDPTSDEGARTTYYGGLSFTFIPEFWSK